MSLEVWRGWLRIGWPEQDQLLLKSILQRAVELDYTPQKLKEDANSLGINLCLDLAKRSLVKS